MPNSLYPAFVVLDYTSAYAPHKMTIPTRAWTAPSGIFTYGSYPKWDDDSEIDALDMVNDFATVLAGAWKNTATITTFTWYTMASPTARPLPQLATTVAIAGTNVSTAQDKARQHTITWRTTTFGISKIVVLDAPAADFDRIADVTDVAWVEDINDELTSVDKAWSGRDGGRPNTFLQVSVTLNERLRRAYRMF
jgi:hypothetical protein